MKVRKPKPQEWFRLHPSKDYQLEVGIYYRDTDDLIKPIPYVVVKDCWDLFKNPDGGGTRIQALRLAVNSLGTEFLWDIRLPRHGLKTDYHVTVDDAAAAAETSWVRLEWNNANRNYDYWEALDDLGEPQFMDGPKYNVSGRGRRDYEPIGGWDKG